MIASRRFIVRCQADQQIVLENARTGVQSRVSSLAGIGEQIGRWLDEPDGSSFETVMASPETEPES